MPITLVMIFAIFFINEISTDISLLLSLIQTIITVLDFINDKGGILMVNNMMEGSGTHGVA